MMDPRRKVKLEAEGWRFGTVQDFLGLSDEDMAYIDLKIALGDALQKKRREGGLTQTELANRMGSSQSRVARMEAGDPSVTIDLLVRGLLAMGLSAKELARIIA